jgi:hypothetical protein
MGIKMLDSSTSLVCREDIDSYLQELLENEANITARQNKSLAHVVDGAIRKTIEKRIADSKECKRALEEGFVPVGLGYFARPDITSKCQKQDEENVLKSMPAEVKEAWKKAEATGIFKSFYVLAARSGGSLLVGKAGDKHFFITGWLDSK